MKDEEALQDNINDLDTDITIKQKLIDELEHSQQRLTALKHQYEQKLGLLHNKIKETEDERDKVLKNIGSVDVAAKEKSDEVRKRYEKKLTTMQKELSKLQNAKREHQRLLRTKVRKRVFKSVNGGRLGIPAGSFEFLRIFWRLYDTFETLIFFIARTKS